MTLFSLLLTATMAVRSLTPAAQPIEKAIADSLFPGAVLCVVDSGRIVTLEAFGNRALVPEVEPMTTHTIFDLASVSKSTGAGSAAVMLIQQGRLHLDDPVSLYLPGFWDYIPSSFPFSPQVPTIRNLLTHTSGLPSYLYVRRLDSLYRIKPPMDIRPRPSYLMDTICTTKRWSAPNAQYAYSCLNFITLQNIVESIVREDLNSYMRRELYGPIGTQVMGWLPADSLRNRIAPTEYTATGCVPAEGRSELVLRGNVHDPLARVMNEGISGNAGIFATADDLAKWAMWFMNLPNEDRVNAAYAGFWVENGNENDSILYHTGYTGTCIRLYPYQKRAIILLTNRVHPYDKGNLKDLRAEVFKAIFPDMEHE